MPNRHKTANANRSKFLADTVKGSVFGRLRIVSVFEKLGVLRIFESIFKWTKDREKRSLFLLFFVNKENSYSICTETDISP